MMESARQHGWMSMLMLILMSCIASESQSADGEIKRKQISPSDHPLGKIVVQVGQVGSHPLFVGNGFIVGSNACHVLTNFHVAFAKDRKADGSFVFVDSIQNGHVVDVGVDLSSKTGDFERKIKARIIDYGNYRDKDKRMARNDLAILKLDECLDRSYGIARFEIPDQRVPDTYLSTLHLLKTDTQRSTLFLEEECVAGNDTPIVGLFFPTCYGQPGVSGSPIFRNDLDGGFTIIGMSSGGWPVPRKPDLPYAIFSSVFVPFVQKALGNEALNGR